MKIYLLRHAEAESASLFGDDSKRPLTPEGEKEMRDIAQGMKTLDLNFDLILTSPYVRAKETANIVAKVCRVSLTDFKESKHLSPSGDTHALVEEIKKISSTTESILLVGHEPYLSSFISLLLSGKSDLPITLKKGGLCKLNMESFHHGKGASLEWLLTPKQLIRIG